MKLLIKIKFLATTFYLILCVGLSAQLVEVQANYNSAGDVDFVAYNNSPAPLFLNIDFNDLENTVFNETLPYVKLIEPGFNTLFTLQREPDAESPRFNYQIKYYRSDPSAIPDLDFPYLIPFKPGGSVSVFDVKEISGFWGNDEPKSWIATGFNTLPGIPVYSARNGIVAEVTGSSRVGSPETWYHTWTNTITVLQPDGTLICYRNVTDNDKKLKPGQKIFAGELIGNIESSSSQLVVMIWQNSFNSTELRFVIPQFYTDHKKGEILLVSEEYKVVHPDSVRGLEMTNREKRRYLKN